MINTRLSEVSYMNNTIYDGFFGLERETLKTAKVDNGGEIEILIGNKIILKDAPEVKEEYVDETEDEDSGDTPDDETIVRGTRKVNTGDATNIYIWVGMLMISLIAAAIRFIRRRRTN